MSKARIYLYKEGNECTAITGGWVAASTGTVGNYGSEYAIKNSDSLDFGDNGNNYGYGGFKSVKPIDLSLYSNIYIDWHQYRSSLNIYSGTGQAGGADSYFYATTAASVSNPYDYASKKFCNITSTYGNYDHVRKTSTASLEGYTNTSGYYLFMHGMSGYINPDIVQTKTYNIYVESIEDICNINLSYDSVIIDLNNLNGIISFPQIEISINNTVIKSYTNYTGNRIIQSTNQEMTNGDIIKAKVVYSQGDNISETIEEELSFLEISLNNIAENRLWLYDHGEEFIETTGGWKGHQFDSSFLGGYYVKGDTYLEYGDNSNSYGDGGFIISNGIDLTNYNILRVKYQLVSAYTPNYNGETRIVLCTTPSPTWRDSSTISKLDGIDNTREGLITKEVDLDISQYEGIYYLGVEGGSGAYNHHTHTGKMYYMYLDGSFEIISITSSNKTEVVFNLNNNLSYKKVYIVSNNKVVATFTDGFDSDIVYTIDEHVSKDSPLIIQAEYTKDGTNYEIAGLSVDIDKDGEFLSDIDKNTIFYLRGDSLNDLSYEPKNIVNGGVVVTDNEQFNKRLYFDKKYIEVSSFDFGLNDFTIEMFFDVTTIQPTGGASRLFAIGGYTDTRAFTCEFSGSNFNFFVGSSATVLVPWGGNVNAVHHLAFVRESNKFYIFIDGVLKSSFDRTVDFAYNTIRFGANIGNNSSELYHGYMNHIRISDIARYTENFTPSEEPLTSLCIKNLKLNNNKKFSCYIVKETPNENIVKTEVLVNDIVMKTFDLDEHQIVYTLDEATLFYGDNNIEVRAYYSENQYISESIVYTKELILQNIPIMPQLPAEATLYDIAERIKVLNAIQKVNEANLRLVLEAKGVAVNDIIRLSDLIVLTKDLGGSHTKIAELTSNLLSIKLQLIDALNRGGYNTDNIESIKDMINALDANKLDLSYIDQICGGTHSFVILKNGEIYSTGRNNYGQLILGDTTNRNVLTKSSFTNIKQISCGHCHTFIVKNDGTVWVCGYNNDGQLGLGDTTNRTSIVQLPNMNDVKQISCGHDFTFILKNDGSVWCCGWNGYGQLGLNDTTNRATFTKVPNMDNVDKIFSGYMHIFLLKNDGSLWACGYNNYGQLGLGDTTNRNTFTQVPNMGNVKKVSCGWFHTLFLGEDNNVWSCGFNSVGQLGLGDTTNRTNISKIPNLKAKDISTRHHANHAIDLDGNLYAWGHNNFGQLGLGNTTNYFTPVLVPDIKNVTHLYSIGTYENSTDYGATAIAVNNTIIYTAGVNNYGQLGLGNTTTYNTFTKVNETILLKEDLKRLHSENISNKNALTNILMNAGVELSEEETLSELLDILSNCGLTPPR